jgi:hypothetical protein
MRDKMLNMDLLVSLDTGIANTGIAVLEKGGIVLMKTKPFEVAYGMVVDLLRDTPELVVVVETAITKKPWHGKINFRNKQTIMQGLPICINIGMGLGAMKLMASLLEQVLLPGHLLRYAPVGSKMFKTGAEFNEVTGWTKQSSSHSRDAAMLGIAAFLNEQSQKF